jgi:hypothetical protein
MSATKTRTPRTSIEIEPRDRRLAGELAAAMTDYAPDRYTPSDVLRIALVRGLLDLSHEYRVNQWESRS